MADVEPLRALHYDLERTGGLQEVIAPPYDVISPEDRIDLEARSPYNVVRIDLPVGDDPYETAAEQLATWRKQGVIVRDEQPAIWALEQDYTGPDGALRQRRGFLARVRVEDYGPGRIRPHERTHPGPKEDRLKLTRATKANLSPIFSLFDDADGIVTKALERITQAEPWGQATDEDGTVNRLWHITDPGSIAEITGAAKPAELLIADGHHRYETARVYADEVGGDGPHQFVLMCLVALEDPGLTVFPTHRLLRDLRPEQHETLASALRTHFDIDALESTEDLAPAYGQPVSLGYIDAHFRQPFRLVLKDQTIADQALADHAAPYRRLDTAVLEAPILKGALKMSDEDIEHMAGLDYARDFDHALGLVESGARDAAFFLAPTPIEEVRAVAAAGESMPPKSTYFFPKVPTGLLFNPLAE
ncbi:MAG TPA: DUF1015 domain-containing protein [Solirubrobacteraceae bacterium]|nr:DUF1015 domain-containing protein [Solirubrobacteraceae bacterium]